ncbi:hypothetical protein HHL21_12220 [Massilia sp. RP-1-19]|uniref:Uncharacterized protein n=1 Tax=Massilia polaris TaxID=2728846 RepID=A0A848HIY5_9BURK|nr:hypothetical protein [Massilia polaris]NML61826.1 hypothetical protein [Massilia polaris]
MAIRYVKSGAAGTADGSSWANAHLTLLPAATAAAPGDTIYVSHAHSESQNSAMTLTFAGTAANPVYVICVNDGAMPPTAVAETAVVATGTGTGSSLAISGCIYDYGVNFRAGVGSTSATSGMTLNNLDGHKQIYANCLLELGGTANALMSFGSSASGGTETVTIFQQAEVKFAATTQRMRFSSAKFRWTGGGIASGSAASANLIAASCQQVIDAEFHGVDLVNLGTSANLIETGLPTSGHVTFANCKLPASWNGELAGGAVVNPGFRAEMHNCDSADTNYRLKTTDFTGSINTDPVFIKSGGTWGSDTPFSFKMEVTNASVRPYFSPLESPVMNRWNTTTGSAITVTAEILHDSATNLTDADIWLEVQYLGASGYPQGTFIEDMKADFLAAAADQTASSATWATTGMTNPNKQKLSVTFMPQEAGYFHARVFLAKPSAIVYIDPNLQVS